LTQNKVLDTSNWGCMYDCMYCWFAKTHVSKKKIWHL